MAQYKISDITNIFWAMNDGFKAGRDPMGVQNSSVATYSCLLPGMTNLTGHIRYYSLYCWLLKEYDDLEKNGQTKLHQYNFIRRAELIMAFVMKDQNVNSVVGAYYVSTHRDVIDGNGYYNIADGADYESKDRYWTFKSGAFGQYYLGSLIQYGLIKVEENRFYLRNNGKALASSFVYSVDEDTRELFLDCILDGNISENEITELLPIGLHQIVVDSEEWKSLNQLLTQVDEGDSSLRRQTVYLMLKDIEEGVPFSDYLKHRFESYRDNDCEAAFGWYFYYLCETLHYIIETIFCLVLNEIDELKNPPVEVLLEKSTKDVLSYLEEERLYSDIAEWMDDCKNDIVSQFTEIRDSIKCAEYSKAVALSLPLLLCLYNEYCKKKEVIDDFENKYDLKRQRGILSKGLDSYVKCYLSLTPREYILALIKQVMNEHTVVAVAKMGNSNVDLRKFLLENGHAVLVEQRYPNLTSPRIESLHNFLIDLGYIAKDNTLTTVAKQFIEEYGKE